MWITAVQVWGSFALCVLLIVVAGIKLTGYGDAIADKTGLGGTWIGLILIAAVTSLPELASGITATAVALLPEIAVGGILGACVYNLLILGMMDLFRRGRPVLSDARPQHVLSAGFGILMMGIAALGLASAPLHVGTAAAVGVTGGLGGIGWTTPVLLAAYVIAIRTLYVCQTREVAQFADREPDRLPWLSLNQVARRYALAAFVVVVAGVWLPFVSRDIAGLMGWEQSFAGTLFTAMSTSLPELVVTLTCLRLGAIDLAVGNLLGSNLINLAILAVDDLFYRPGPLLASVSGVHLVTAVSAITMSTVVIIAVFYRSDKRLLGLIGWPGLLLMVLFGLNFWLVWTLGGP
jgi:cation:H+ antiporter